MPPKARRGGESSVSSRVHATRGVSPLSLQTLGSLSQIAPNHRVFAHRQQEMGSQLGTKHFGDLRCASWKAQKKKDGP